MRLALCQMTVGNDKHANLQKAKEMAATARTEGAAMLVLPEMFTCPYQADVFGAYAESFPQGPTLEALSEMASANNLVVVGGSAPENDGGLLYNACHIFGPRGEFLGRHRKVHLFDVDLPGGVSFRESSTLAPGEKIDPIPTPLGRIGIAVCYDIRFPELVRRLVLGGAWLILVPAAFNPTTGPAHWGLTLRARAVDNQVFIAGVSRARIAGDTYVAYAHSMAVDPWGTVLGEAGIEEKLLIVDIDPARMEEIRARLPLLAHRRPDKY